MLQARLSALTWLGIVAALVVLAAHASYTAFLCDDAYITFRYVRNLLDGHGLVFNPGEYVEGYSNFLWALQLAVVWAVGLGPETGSWLLSGLSTLGVVAVFVRLAGTSPFARTPAAPVSMALLLLVTNRSFAIWSTSGLETRQFTLFVLLGVWLLHRGTSSRGLVLAGCAFALALLSRVEGMLFGALGGAWLLVEAWRTGRGWRRALRDVAWLALPQVAVAGAHLAFRLYYYGAPLPNTYYAKGGETWWEGGAVFVEGFAVEYGLVVLLPLAVVGAVARWRRGDGLHVLSALLVAPQQLAVARIGGDHFEYRMMDVLLPLLFLAVVDGVLFLGERAGRASVAVVSLGTMVALLYATAIPTLHYVATADHDNSRGRAFEFHVALGREHAGPLWYLPGLPQLVARHNTLRAWAAPRMIGTRLLEHRDFGIRQRERWSPYDGVEVPPGLVAVLGVMGIEPFFLKDIAFVDLYGLTDATIARMPPLHRPGDQRRLAHPRKDYGAYTKARRNVGKVHLAVDSPDRALRASPFALQLRQDVWMPFDGHRIPAVLEGERVVASRPLSVGLEVRADRRSHRVEEVLFDFEVAADWMQPFGIARGRREGQARFRGLVGRSALNSFGRPGGTVTSPAVRLRSGQSLGLLLGGDEGCSVTVSTPDGPVRTVHPRGRDLSMVVVEVPAGVELTLQFDRPQDDAELVVDQVVAVRTLGAR